MKQQHPIKVHDEDGTLLGDFYADIFVENQLIVEIKACKALAPEHTAQVLGYLRATKIEHGLLINFGAPKLQIRKYNLSETAVWVLCAFCGQRILSLLCILRLIIILSFLCFLWLNYFMHFAANNRRVNNA